MRKNLKEARQKAGMTQQQVAAYLHICDRHYKYIEAGKVRGNIDIWDMLEDLFEINQRKLREISESHHDKEDSL